MFYLQKIIAMLQNDGLREDIEKLEEALRGQGIDFRCFWTADMHIERVSAEEVVNAAWKKLGAEQADLEDESIELEERSACLWMTDMSELVRVLCVLKQPVLAVLHQENRNQDFSAALYACEAPGDLDAEYLDRVYRRYKQLPWDILETERCLIRETTVEDVDAFWEMYQNPELTRYTEGLYPTIEAERQYIREYIEKVYGFYGFGVWTILKKDMGEVIGRVGFSYREGFEEPEIGFVIGVPWQNQGLAYEVCSALMTYAREELYFEVVQAFVMPENRSSRRLCEKLGLRKIGSLRMGGIKYDRFRSQLSK